MKKLSYLSFLVLMVALAASCATAEKVENVPPYTYTGDKELYPAIAHVIVNGEPSVWVDSTSTIVDLNTIIIDNVRVNDGLFLADFTLKISLVDNVVTYQFSNRRRKDINGNWNHIEYFSQPGRETIFTNYFNTEIPKVMENEDAYWQALEDAFVRGGETKESAAAEVADIKAKAAANKQ